MTKYKYIKGLHPLKGKTREIHLFGFDCETANNNKDLLCCSLVGDLNIREFFTRKSKFVNFLQSEQKLRRSYIVATNLMFDLNAIFSPTEILTNFDIIERAGSIIYAKTYIRYKTDYKFYTSEQLQQLKLDGKIKDIGKEFYSICFIDSLNHFSGSVKKLGEIINFPKLPSPSYLGEEPKNYDEWKYLQEYNIRDSEVTYKFMKWLQEYYNKLGCNLKLTISSTSSDLYRRKFLKSVLPQEPKDSILEQYKSYYGGRTEVFKRGNFGSDNYGKIKVYDVNSLYPFVMKKHNFPYPESYFKKKITTDDIDSFNGVCNITLKCPNDLNVPLLPMKLDKLKFMTGIVKGDYDFHSLRTALNLGYEVEEIGQGLVYEHTHQPFKEFVKTLYKTRLEFKKLKNGTDIIPKILLNSHYGKYGYNYTNKEKLMLFENINKFDYANSTLIPYRDNVWRVISSTASSIPSYVFPIYSLYTTAYARTHMYKLFQQLGFKRLFYSDTDCIFTDRVLQTGDDIGELKLENCFSDLMLIKPKFYGGVTVDNENVIKVKGLHGAVEDYKKFKEMVRTTNFKVTRNHFRKLRGVMNSGKGYVNEVYQMTKEMSFNDTKRVWDNKNFSMKPQNSNAIENFI